MRTRRQKLLEDRESISRRNSQAQLPIDLIIEILLKLPVKSIARCRCVSKLWSSTILQPEFVDLVMTRSATTQPQLLFACKTDSKIYFYSTPQPQEESFAIRFANYHMSSPFTAGWALNYVHGLICLKHTEFVHALVICNPSTGQSLTLPGMKTKRFKALGFFGYDHIGKQFKVLSMTIPSYGRDTFVVSGEHQVLTLGNGKLSWRMIKCNIPHYPLFDDGICINGVLYYQAKVNGFEGKSMIVSFDIRSEKFKLIEEGEKYERVMLVNYKGKLATLDDSFDIVYEESISFKWRILEDAETHKWSTHTYVLPPLSTDIAEPYGMAIEGVTRTGEIVLSPLHRSRPFYFLYYNLERKTIRKVEVQGIDMSKYYGVHTFVDHVEDVRVFQTS